MAASEREKHRTRMDSLAKRFGREETNKERVETEEIVLEKSSTLENPTGSDTDCLEITSKDEKDLVDDQTLRGGNDGDDDLMED